MADKFKGKRDPFYLMPQMMPDAPENIARARLRGRARRRTGGRMRGSSRQSAATPSSRRLRTLRHNSQSF